MKTEQIRLVLAIARERSISKASEAVGISQPSASNMLKALEQELGYPLFERTRAGALPTDEGAEFIEYAEAIERSLQAIDRIRQPVKRVDLTILSGKSEITDRAFKCLCEKYLTGDYGVTLGYKVVSNTEDAVRMVYAGNGDIAVALCRKSHYEAEVRSAADRHLCTSLLGEFHLELTCAKGHPILQGGTIDINLLGSYPCFSSVPMTNADPYISYTISRYFNASQNSVVIDHGKLRYQLLRKTNGYLVSAPVSERIKQEYELESIPIEHATIVAYATYRQDPLKQDLIDEYIQSCRELGVGQLSSEGWEDASVGDDVPEGEPSEE